MLSARSLALSSLLVIAACGGSNSNPTSPSSTPAVVVPFEATELRIGCCLPVTTGQLVTVDFAGWLYDSNAVDNKGLLFDASLLPGREPLQFQVGTGQVIVGFEQTVIGMQVSGARRVTIPPALAYGSQGSGAIPPNAAVVFEIELLAIQ